MTHIIAVLSIIILGWAAPMQAKAETIFALTGADSLLSFDSSAPGAVNTIGAITGLQSGESLLGIDFRPATLQLYGLGNSNRLYTINTVTGAATQVGSAGAFILFGSDFGFDFNPTVDRIRVTSNLGQNLRLNPNDGTLTMTDTPLAYAGAPDPNAGIDPSIVGSAYTNNFAGALSTVLYGIDSNLEILATQNPPNNGTLNTVGSLGPGIATSGLVGFDISGATGTAFASLTGIDANSSELFTINLTTGAATLIGTIGGGTTILGLSAAPIAPSAIPEPATLVLLASGLLALAAGAFRRRKA